MKLAASLLAAQSSAATHLGHASAWAVFATGAVLILSGAFGVVLMRNPVHSALMLVVTLFGVALMFIDQSADFLAAVQIIVYAGAIVVLFLFVIMFLGVDKREVVGRERFRAQKPLALALGLASLIEIFVLTRLGDWSSGAHSVSGQATGPGENVQKLGQSVFTRFLLPFEMTAALLVIAVVAAVVLARRREPVAGEMTQSEQEEMRS